MNNTERTRNTWEETALQLAETMAESRSPDPYVQVGACILRPDNSVAAVGYNGAPADIEIDWSDRDGRRQYVIHAEQNALSYVRPGECSLLAVTMIPCLDCLKAIAKHKIKKVVYRHGYSSTLYGTEEKTMEIANKLGLELKKL